MSPILDFSPCQDHPGTSNLLPTIAQDVSNGRILMIARLDEQAWNETVESRQAACFRRSRGKFWRMGEIGGHRQVVSEVRADCHTNAIPLRVQPDDVACHESYERGFFSVDRFNGAVKDGAVKVGAVKVGATKASTGKIADQPQVDPPSVDGKSS